MIFGNKSLLIHVARGFGGLGLVAISVHLIGTSHGWLAFLLMPAALYLLKGCPICWTIGLFETLVHRAKDWSGRRTLVSH